MTPKIKNFAERCKLAWRTAGGRDVKHALLNYSVRLLGRPLRSDEEGMLQDLGRIYVDLLDLKTARAAGFAAWSKYCQQHGRRATDREAMLRTINDTLHGKPITSRSELTATDWRYLAFQWEPERTDRMNRAVMEGSEYLWDLDDEGAFWRVESLSGECYEVTPQSCTCEDWVCQPLQEDRAKPRRCKHILALAAQVGHGLKET